MDLNPVLGQEQAGQRPVLVVSIDAINCQPLVVTVLAGTDAAHITRDYPTNIRLTAGETGLHKDTVFLAFQIRSLDPAGFAKTPAGAIPPHRESELDNALRFVFGL